MSPLPSGGIPSSTHADLSCSFPSSTQTVRIPQSIQLLGGPSILKKNCIIGARAHMSERKRAAAGDLHSKVRYSPARERIPFLPNYTSYTTSSSPPHSPSSLRTRTHTYFLRAFIYIPTHVLSLAPLLARGSPVQFTLSLRPGALAGPCSHSAPPRAPRPAPRLFSGHGEKKEREREEGKEGGVCTGDRERRRRRRRWQHSEMEPLRLSDWQ